MKTCVPSFPGYVPPLQMAPISAWKMHQVDGSMALGPGSLIRINSRTGRNRGLEQCGSAGYVSDAKNLYDNTRD
jgi:hypothetical protein